MSIAEVTLCVGAERYTRIDWKSIKAIEGHPLDFLLSQGIPVYCKIHRELFFAYRHQWTPLARRAAEPIPELVANEVAYSTIQRDERLLLLQLDDEDLCEILVTGSRVVTEFSLGGLGLAKQEAGGSAGVEVDLFDVDFHRCYLVNRKRWESAQHSAGISAPRPEGYAEPICIDYEDLYLQCSDVTALKNVKTGVGVEREPYPFAVGGRKLPAPMNWLYQAAFAINRDGENGRQESESKSWLRTNSPDKIFSKRWVRTAASLIPIDYKFGSRFDEGGLADYRMGEALRSDHVSIALTFALAITEWWLDEKSDLTKRIELAGRLQDVGFQATAVYDLTGMISGKVVRDDEMEEFDALLDECQKKKSHALAKHRREYGIALADGEGSVVAGRAISDSGGLADGDSGEEAGKSCLSSNWAPRI